MINKNKNIIVLISVLILILSQIACKIERIEESIPEIVPTFTTIPTNISPTITPIPTSTKNVLFGSVYNCEFLNLRIEGNDKSSIITSIPAGQQVMIISSENGWYYVLWDEYSGWVNGSYVLVGQ
jgi:uncharacterized protein YgiM (DUF1202 family)